MIFVIYTVLLASVLGMKADDGEQEQASLVESDCESDCHNVWGVEYQNALDYCLIDCMEADYREQEQTEKADDEEQEQAILVDSGCESDCHDVWGVEYQNALDHCLMDCMYY